MSMHRTRQGFTLIELLVVISIIAILAGLLLPAVTLVKNKANQAANGNNQKQIVTAMASYQGDFDQQFPLAILNGGAVIPVTAPVSAADGRLVAYASLETLAAQAQLPNKIFFAKGQKEAIVGGVTNSKPPLLATDANFGANTWSSRQVGGGEIAWCYDWCAPSMVASYRVILADRGNWHKTKVVAVSADTSIKVFNAGTGTAGTTLGMDVLAIPATTMGATTNPDANFGGPNGENSAGLEDFIYTCGGDGTLATGAIVNVGNSTTSNGDSRRAWVK